MNRSEQELERGRRMFRRIFGPQYGEQLCAQLGEGEFNRILMCRIAPEIWELDALDLKSKILCAIAASTAAHQDVRYFVRAGIHHGISRRAMEQCILLAGLESGFPAAGVAKRLLDAAYTEHEAMLAGKAAP